jgi:aspartyl-tRNA(Asn)/glutamyl-tRNA(Gln) amidotransferase subunit A
MIFEIPGDPIAQKRPRVFIRGKHAIAWDSQGKDKDDSTTFDLTKIQTKTIQNPKDIIIGIPKEYFGEGLDPEIKDALNQKIEMLKQEGFKTKEVSIPSTKYALAVYYILVPAEISSNRGRYDSVRYGKKVSNDYEENMVQSRSRYLEDEVKRRIMIGTYSLSKGYADKFYKQASKVRSKLKEEFDFNKSIFIFIIYKNKLAFSGNLEFSHLYLR